ncbi:ARM repeat-containing protein [Hortaea werneckii]|nr:ARM repeat-containing protein [Hortaea werneckii]KAI7325485.1 ARM repeat-containing protein [Hortaea werneckii]
MPFLGPTMEGRNQTFQHLKPRCVSLSQDVLALHGPRGDVAKITRSVQELKTVVAKEVPNLDPKLGDYIFFPLSQLLKLSQKVSLRCLELSLECIAIVIEHAWGRHIQTQLAAQIVILCTLMGERKPRGFAFGETSEELKTAAFLCLKNVFISASASTDCVTFFRSESNFPQLGQTISTTLDGITESEAVQTQVAGAESFKALVESVADREICASFLPGIVSKLTKILTPSTTVRRNHRVLMICLDVLGGLLKTTVGTEERDCSSKRMTSDKRSDKGSIIDAKWKENAATQLKPALHSVLRLSEHSREDVRESLAELCLTLLEYCRITLANCSQMALETLFQLSAGSISDNLHTTGIRLEMLLKADPPFTNLLQSTTNDWLQSLPTLMQGSNEYAKVRKIRQISAAYGLIRDAGLETSMLDKMLASALRDIVVITLQSPNIKAEGKSFVSSVQSLDLTVLEGERASTEFSNALIAHRGQEEILTCVERFAKIVGSSGSSAMFAGDLARSLRYSNAETQIADFWLLLTATQNALRRQDDMSSLLDLGSDDGKAGYMDCLEELYSFALTILNSSSSDEDSSPDERLQSLALRALALRAQTAGADFRYELIDALYPVLHTLATPSTELQRDSITTLNIFTTACQYDSVRDLIVENVDYLTNAVSLKLNAFDLSPQVPMVMVMMVRLAGSSVIPYMEDVVESIFAVLEGWHGYSMLVEVLFRVLRVVAEEGAKAPQLAAIEDGEKVKVEAVVKEKWRPTNIFELASSLREKRAEEIPERGEREKAPQRPWKSNEEVGGSAEENDGEDELDTAGQSSDDVDLPPPAPKTYGLLLKITELTQHFLPAASPSLRTSLLSLIRTAVPPISKHENSFLPLINTLWPEIVSRLDDGEPQVQASALDIIGVLCEHAGDFMRTRIIELWPGLAEVYRRTARDIVSNSGSGKVDDPKKRSIGRQTTSVTAWKSHTSAFDRALRTMYDSPTHYIDTSTRLVWDAFVEALTTVIKHVPLSPELFDDALEMLAPVLDSGPDVRKALEAENADAVWLLLMKRGKLSSLGCPEMPEALTRQGIVWPVVA